MYVPRIATSSEPLTFKLNPPREQYWRGSAEAALALIPACIALGENPLILEEQAIPHVYKTPSPVIVPRNLTSTIYSTIVQTIGFQPEYESLFNKASQYLVDEKGKVQLTQTEIEQLFKLLRIEPIREQEKILRLQSGQLIKEMDTMILPPATVNEAKIHINVADYTATDDDIRPKGALLFDPDDFDEEGEPEPERPPEPEPVLEPEPTLEPATIPQPSCYNDPNSPEFKQLQAETEAELQKYYASRPLSIISYNDTGRSFLKPYKDREKINKRQGRKFNQSGD